MLSNHFLVGSLLPPSRTNSQHHHASAVTKAAESKHMSNKSQKKVEIFRRAQRQVRLLNTSDHKYVQSFALSSFTVRIRYLFSLF